MSWTDQATVNGNNILQFELRYAPYETTGPNLQRTFGRSSRTAEFYGLVPGKPYTIILRGITGAGTVELDRVDQSTGK